MTIRTIGIAVLLLPLAGTAALAGPVAFVPYRAAYDLAADETTEAPDVAGRLVMEFTGSRCDGYTSQVRFVTALDDSDGGRLVTDARSTTFETADGRFDFVNQVYANDTLVEDSKGRVVKGPDGATLTLTKPVDKTVSLGRKVVFPTEQLVRILEAASAGKTFVPLQLYDGAEAGETVFDTATVIGAPSTADDDFGRDGPIGVAGFAGLRHWPLTMSYFARGTHEDNTPDYVMSFVLYENGIGRGLKIDYGNFAVVATLVHLDMLPVPHCP